MAIDRASVVYIEAGRYLVAGGASKALTPNEIQIILNSGLRFFPIFQRSANSASYFTPAQAESDVSAAVEAANNLGIPFGTIIYFAVDFDAMDVHITNNIIPYFQVIRDELRTQGNRYKPGIYGPRNVCTRVVTGRLYGQ